MAVSSNSNAGSTETKLGAGALSNFNTENKSNGNFSGGDISLDTSKLSINNPFNTNEPTFNVDNTFNPNVSGNLDIDLPKTNNNTTYSNNSEEPTMTVDEVYGKSSNQSVVEKQGDYSASSNEKSNVETSTFGKQDEVSVTPNSVTENKGMVDSSAIQSVEGLDFQQKDKASVDVLDSKKKRDEVEAEDKADSMRNKLKANVNNAKQEEGGENFKIGDRDEDLANAQKEVERLDRVLQSKSGILNQKTNKVKDAETKYSDLEAQLRRMESEYEDWQNALAQAKTTIADLEDQAKQLAESGGFIERFKTERSKPFQDFKSKLSKLADVYGIDIGDISKAGIDEISNITSKVTKPIWVHFNQETEECKNQLSKVNKAKDDAEQTYKAALDEEMKAKNDLEATKKEYNRVKKYYNNLVNNQTVGAVDTPETKTSDTKQVFDNAIKKAIENGADEQTVQEMTDIATSIEDVQAEMKKAIAANDYSTYVKAQKRYNELLEEASRIGNRFTQTDYNKDYVTAVAKANDFEVTLSDGTKQQYSQFATDTVTKSPEVAAAMYNAKADRLETEGHPILAKIERWKAKMAGNWFGSKLIFADNQVRDQFNQMAKTNIRATYDAYNNVLNDPNATPEQKAEAQAQIEQANSLMTASTALKASTGFLSGIGDGMGDGVYGTTDPEARNAWQKTLNAVDNFVRITLGLGISPAANKAYQNMYYMAGAKVNESGLFSRDFDSDGFALCQEYGNNAATGMIAGAGELATGVALMFNPASMTSGLNLIADSVQTFSNGLYGVRNEAEKSQKYTQEVLEYFKEASDIAESSGNEEAVQEIANAITQIENFELKFDEVGNLDNWLEGSGSNTTSNEKFNQSLTYDEWLKLIEADPTMKEFAKSLTEKKKGKNAKKDSADTGVNS